MDAQDIGAVRGAAGTAARSVPGWILGACLVLFGALMCVWMGGDVRGELLSSPDQGTFTVRSCRPADGSGYTCTGSFSAETGDPAARGTLHTDVRRTAGDSVHVEDALASFTENTYKPVPPDRLGGEVVVLGLAAAASAAGVFALLTGYSPRPLYAAFGRWANAYHDRRRVTFAQAWTRLPARRAVAPVLAVVAGLGVLTAAAGGVVLALA